MSATPMTLSVVGAAPPPRSTVRGALTTASAWGQASYKIAPESAAWVERARPRPVGVAPSPRSTVRGASTVVSAWGQASVVVDDSSSVQPRPTPCGCSHKPPCRSGALAAINGPLFTNGRIAPRAGLPQTTLTLVKAAHAIAPSPLRGEGWGLAASCPLAGLLECLVVPSEGDRPPSIPLSEDHQNAEPPHPHLIHSTKAWAPALMGK